MWSKVVGFSHVFQVTDKKTGELKNKINISVEVQDPEYASGVRCQELYLPADNVDYSWLIVGVDVYVSYNKFGFATGVFPVK